jgi:hypothetical protein
LGVLKVLHVNPLVKVRTTRGAGVKGAPVLALACCIENCLNGTLKEALHANTIAKQRHVLLTLIIGAVRAWFAGHLHELVSACEVHPCCGSSKRAACP